MSRPAALLALLLLSPTHVATGQDTPAAQDQASPGAERLMGVIASVNGTPITLSDVAHMMDFLRASGAQGLGDAELGLVARMKLGEEILLAAEASRRGLSLTDVQVTDWLTRLIGERPDFGLMARSTGTTVDHQVALAKRQALAEYYVSLRTSTRQTPGAPIAPDPTLVRLLEITPSELRREFADNRAYYDRPESVEVTVYLCRDEEAANLIANALREGLPPPRGSNIFRETHPVEQLERAFSPEVAAFLSTATEEQIGPVVPLEEGAVFVKLDQRLEAREALFSEAQKDLRFQLERIRRREARNILVRQLMVDAAYWPGDVFEPEEALARGRASSAPSDR